MTTERQKDICLVYDVIEDQCPDISTERLLSMTADQAGCGIGDVVDALVASGKAIETPQE